MATNKPTGDNARKGAGPETEVILLAGAGVLSGI
jgi:hypothetical protein